MVTESTSLACFAGCALYLFRFRVHQFSNTLFFFILLSNATSYFTSEWSQQFLLSQVDLQSFPTKESCGRPLLVTPNPLSDQTLQIGS